MLSKISKLISILNILFLSFQVGLCLHIICNFDIVPIHWGIDGNVNSIADSTSVLILPGSSIFVWGLCAFFKKNPQYCNLPTKIKNLPKAYDYVKQLLNWIILWSFCLTSFLIFCVYYSDLFAIGMLIINLFFIFPIIYFSKKIYNYNHNDINL